MKKIMEQMISVEEFDAINEKHEFSEAYQEEKRRVLMKMRQKTHRRNQLAKVAVAVVAFSVIVPATIYASMGHDKFFENVFGDNNRKDNDAFDKTVMNDEMEVTVTVPATDYVPVELEKAEELLGEYVMNEAMVKDVDGHTLTIHSVIYDSNAVISEFSLEKKGGVTAMELDEKYNYSKAEPWTEAATFRFNVNIGDIYLNVEESTPEKISGTIYSVIAEGNFNEEIASLSSTPKLEILDYVTGERENVSISDKEAVPMHEFVSETGGSMYVSPISLKVNMKKGFSFEYPTDSGNIKTININYNDGTEYCVYDDSENIDNTSYICGVDGMYKLIFNRLVDVKEIKSIHVNGVEYLKK